MMTIAICIGSSCHLKGSEDLVEMFQKAISENGLENEIELIGSFCLGKCNRDGVTVQIDDDVFQGVNRENFDRDPSLEQYAYQFIHIDNPAEIFNMNFDIIVSNPPYSMKDGGGRGGDGAKQIFNYFV